MPKDNFSLLHDHRCPPTYKFFDGKKWLFSTTGKTIGCCSPVDNNLLGYIQKMSKGEIHKAIERVKKAQEKWKKEQIRERAKILHLAADWLREHESYFTTLLVKEIGKSCKEAKDEVLRSADMIDYFVNEALTIHGEEVTGGAFPGYSREKIAIVEKEPIGIILAISPFNYPINLAVSKIAPALIMGNGVVFKPSTKGVISALHLARVFQASGLPDGILAVVTGSSAEISEYLVTHPGVDLISFTGSTKVGKKIAKKIEMKPILMECEGNNPALVLPDADMNDAAKQLVRGAFSYSGQRCTAIKYVLALTPTIDRIIPEVVKQAKKIIKMGDPRNHENNFGPLISSEAVEEVEKRIYLAKAGGAKILYGGERNELFITPTILDKVRIDMEIVEKETFGPVLSFIRISSIEEAISLINKSKYGLQASIFTSDEGAGIRLGRKLNVGSVQINGRPQRGPDNFPFIGIKDSGIGVQGIHYTLESMVRVKPIILNKPH